MVRSKTKCPTVVFLALIFLPSLLMAAPLEQDAGTDGLVVAEVENNDGNTPQGGRTWAEVFTPTGFSGTSAHQAQPTGIGNIGVGFASLSPRLDYQIDFNRSGTHYVWIRGRGDNSSSNSVYVGLDGIEVPSTNQVLHFNAGAGWEWSSLRDVGVLATVEVPTVGVHTVNIWIRESATFVDKLLLTSNVAYIPTGLEPESTRGVGGGNLAPVAVAGGPYSGVEGSAISFDGSGSYDPDSSNPLTYSWDFGDGALGTGASPSHAYAVLGVAATYTVSLIVNDGTEDSVASTATVNVSAVPPPGGGANVTLGNAIVDGANLDSWSSNLLVNETDTYTNSSGVVEQVSVDRFAFYARRVADPVTPFVVRVNGNNNFTVLAIGTTRTGYSVGANDVAFSDGGAVLLSLNPGETLATGFLDANADGSGGGSGSVIPWDNGGDELWYTGGGSGSASGGVTVGLPPTPGSSVYTTLNRDYHYQIRLTTNGGGGGANQAPVAAAGGPYSGVEGTPIVFDGTGSYDPDSSNPLTYSWDFGDGALGTGASPSHAYAVLGVAATYTVSLIVNDGTEDSVASTATVTVDTAGGGNLAPVAVAGGPYSGVEGSAISFDGSGSYDPDSSNPLTYSWDFGDGALGTGASPSHAYAVLGVAATYTVSLIVNDGTEDSVASTATVNVSAVPPPGGGANVTLGNAVVDGAKLDSWSSNLLVNETDTYTNTSGSVEQVSIDRFAFYARRVADPVTPFVVRVNGNNNFTVLAIGTTRTGYSVGANDVAFSDGGAVLLSLNPGETLATGFLDANADGSGGGSGSVIPWDNGGDELWYTGGGSGSASGRVTVGLPPTPGSSVYTTLNRDYHYQIRLTTNGGGGGANQAPVAAAGGPYSGVEGTPIVFDGTGSYDPDSSNPLTYSWDFGDGALGTGASPSHAYAVLGVAATYTVSLIVNDGTEDSVASTATVNVSAVPPPGGGANVTLGNAVVDGAKLDSWSSNLLVNETDTYTNTSGSVEQVSIDRFAFYARRVADPVTPFVVRVNGNNNFTVLAIGTTRTGYSVGANDVAFSDGGAVLLSLNPGETLATGFLDANADGSGGGSGSVIPWDNGGDELWYTGGGSGSASGGVTVGLPPTPGSSVYTTLNRNYHYQIRLTVNGGGGTGTLFSDDFNDGDALGWSVVDECVKGSHSWSVVNNIYMQTGECRGYSPEGVAIGSYRVSNVSLPSDVDIQLSFSSQDPATDAVSTNNSSRWKFDTIGVLFGYQDSGNHYRFELDGMKGHRKLWRKQDGAYTELNSSPQSFVRGQWHDLRIIHQNEVILIFIDGQQVMAAEDSTFSNGPMALFCARNTSCNFDDVRVVSAPVDPMIGVSITDSATNTRKFSESFVDTDNLLDVSAFTTLSAGIGGIKFVLDEGMFDGDGNPLEQVQSVTVAPYSTQFNVLASGGQHTVTAYLLNGSSVPLATPGASATLPQIGIDGIHLYVIGDSISNGLDDDLQSDDVSLDGRNTGGGYAPILNDYLSQDNNGKQVTVLNDGNNGETSAEGVARINKIIARTPEVEAYLVFYGANDSGTVPATDPVIFKDNIQQLIDAVPAGKLIILAKAPPYLASTVRNNLVVQYNQMIDDLIDENSLGYVSPDLYGHFISNQSEYSADLIHPDGVGYQSIARIMCEGLNGKLGLICIP